MSRNGRARLWPLTTTMMRPAFSSTNSRCVSPGAPARYVGARNDATRTSLTRFAAAAALLEAATSLAPAGEPEPPQATASDPATTTKPNACTFLRLCGGTERKCKEDADPGSSFREASTSGVYGPRRLAGGRCL